MTQEVLVTVIMTLCDYESREFNYKENFIQCIDKYVNCAIVKDGQILTLQEFNKKCLK